MYTQTQPGWWSSLFHINFILYHSLLAQSLSYNLKPIQQAFSHLCSSVKTWDWVVRTEGSDYAGVNYNSALWATLGRWRTKINSLVCSNLKNIFFSIGISAMENRGPNFSSLPSVSVWKISVFFPKASLSLGAVAGACLRTGCSSYHPPQQHRDWDWDWVCPLLGYQPHSLPVILCFPVGPDKCLHYWWDWLSCRWAVSEGALTRWD